MARIVAEESESSFSQVIHSVGVPHFGEAQGASAGRLARNNVTCPGLAEITIRQGQARFF